MTLTLAADARLGPTDYYNDQIWELSLGGGEPPALAVQTTYGLRARAMRIFPRFGEGENTISDPAAFKAPPTIQAFYPNFYRLSFMPFQGIQVTAEFWTPDSHSITGRLQFTNAGSQPRQIQLDWVALLTPASEGQRIIPATMDSQIVLAGQTGMIAPVIVVTGASQASVGPYPALSQTVMLPPSGIQQVTWAQAALVDALQSLTLARKTLAYPWDAETARIELINNSAIEIHTGNRDWDIAFAQSQKTALGLFVGPTQHLPAASFVSSRQPDQGYSPRGDGLDYTHPWNGQTALEAHYLFDYLLPAYPQLAQGVLRNFLASQSPDGAVDWKPGLGGQRGQLPATPILADLAWKIYEITQDAKFLEETFPSLLASVQNWFTPQRDRDGDGVPEWDHPMQTGFDDHPLFAHWQPLAQGIEITTVESPDLCAFLYRECQTLIRIGEILGRKEPLSAIESFADHLKTAVEAAWDESVGAYHYWDRESHGATGLEHICEGDGNGEMLADKQLEQPSRLLLKILAASGMASRPQVFVHGVGLAEQHLIERMPPERFRWHNGIGRAATERLFSKIERIEIQGIEPTDHFSADTVELSLADQTTLLPLWAGIPPIERGRRMVKQAITNPKRFWRPFGLRACAALPNAPDNDYPYQYIHLIWNALVGKGLVQYNQRAKAAELVTHLMNAITNDLKRCQSFHRVYHAETGAGTGERNALVGLAPLGLFLNALGVEIISPACVVLEGFNPFPWSVTVKYRGMTILRQKKKTTVIFPDGQTVTVNNPKRNTVMLT